MSWERLGRWLGLALALSCGVFAGYFLHQDDAVSGGVALALAVLFLYLSREKRPSGGFEQDVEPGEETADFHKGLQDLLLLVTDESLGNLKQIGRTMPCTSAEVARLEDRVTSLLTLLDIDAAERARLAEEFENLKNRARQNEGRRALSQSTRL